MDSKYESSDIFELLDKCGDFFVAMGDEIRRSLIKKLIKAGADGLNVQALAQDSQLSRPAISHHVKILKECGLIKVRKSGTSNFYYVDLNQELMNVKDFVMNAEKILANMKQSESRE